MCTGFVSNLTLDATVNGLPTRTNNKKLQHLYRQALGNQWRPDEDIDWLESVNYGAPLPASSKFAYEGFANSPLKKGGVRLWDEFRWELQSWLVCQFLYGEQAALVTTSRLTMCLKGSDEKLLAASQVADEARHVTTFGRYVDNYVENPYPMSKSLQTMLSTTLEDTDWDLTLLGMQVIIEGLADATFRMGASTFHDPVIRQIVDLVAADEARHVAFGAVLLKQNVLQLSANERLRREEFILDAAAAIRHRFMLEEVWQRLDVDKVAGQKFAAESPLMIGFRRTIFAKIATVLNKIGLMSERVHGHLQQMQLVR